VRRPGCSIRASATRSANSVSSPPWVTAFGGAVILVAYGARGSAGGAGSTPYEDQPGRGRAGVRGRWPVRSPCRERSTSARPPASAGRRCGSKKSRGSDPDSLPRSPVIQGAMKTSAPATRSSTAWIPAAAPLIIVRPTVLGIAASKADWPQFDAALTSVTGGVVAGSWDQVQRGWRRGSACSSGWQATAAATSMRFGHS